MHFFADCLLLRSRAEVNRVSLEANNFSGRVLQQKRRVNIYKDNFLAVQSTLDNTDPLGNVHDKMADECVCAVLQVLTKVVVR